MGFIPRLIEKFLDLANLQKHNDNYQDISNELSSLAGVGRTTESIKGNSDALAALSGNTYTKAQIDGKDTAVATAAQAALDTHKASGDHDARYNTKTQLQTSGQAVVHWDNLSNKPNFADARWKAPVATFANLPLTGNTDGDVRLVLGDETVYEWDGGSGATNKWRAIGAIGNGLTSHSSLTDLTNDDHPQYHTDGRGDARYYIKSVTDTMLGTKINQGGTLDADLNFDKHEAKNLVIHKSNTAPASPTEGQPWYDSANHALMIYKGSVQGWVDVSGKGALIRDQEWIALPGQTVFDITVGQYEVNTNAVTIYKKNAGTGKYEVVPEEEYQETNATRFTLLSAAAGGEGYFIRFFENSPEVINQSVKRDGTLQVNLNSDMLNGKHDADFALVGHDHSTGTKISSSGLANGAATDTIIGNRTVDDTATPNAGPNTITNLFNYFGKMIRQITGEASWVTAPAMTIAAIATALGLKAPLASPALTGIPTTSTAAAATSTTQIASTAFTQAAIDAKYTASDILAKIKTVDGNGSGLDADTLRGAIYDTNPSAYTLAQRDGSGVMSATRYFAKTGNKAVDILFDPVTDRGVIGSSDLGIAFKTLLLSASALHYSPDGGVSGYVIWHGGNFPVFSGNGSPEGAITASVGSLYRRLDGGAITTLYVKESGSGNTGWVAK
ncbi:hypothetical protein OB236_38300 [Paenibacillus sp. WQ 127069]|uniref:Uncharacterized protein n=1 Tax=Paenibacillus baimaensis TaxID=2982185 RepID=A0ABT2UTQ4_9BACL|nr:hypothetical protein [Paenibacillus sp. WQ 127069]MCU6797993.1 hypothetical protein [Paenibacillus sp. WQ 127069]